MEKSGFETWLFDSDNLIIVVYRPNQPTITLRAGDMLDGGDVLPGLSADVAAIFAVLDEVE